MRHFQTPIIVFLAFALPALAAENQGPAKMKDTIWTLELKLHEPKIVRVNIPGLGQRDVWYVHYEVANNTNQEHCSIPDFRLWSNKSNTAAGDEALPLALQKIRGIEDPAGALALKDSVAIAGKPIPPGKKVHGIAAWANVDPATTTFTVYVRGLSNAYTLENDNSYQKTFEMKFERTVNAKLPGGQEIRPAGKGEWIYRSTHK